MPQISVIMNCLNGEKYLPQALASLRKQTCQDFEIVFWDNCSTDRSAAIAQNFGSSLRYYRSDQVLPLGAARNRAIAQACAPYIAFLDCDDLWEAGKLEKQLTLAKTNPAVGLVTTDTTVFNENGPLYNLFERAAPCRGEAFAPLMLRQWISMSSAFISRPALDAIAERPGVWFDESLNVCEEADLFYRIAHEYEIDYIDEPLTSWRVHKENTTFHRFGQFAEETGRILAKHRRLYPGYDSRYPELVQALTERKAFQKGISLWQAGDGRGARAAIRPYLGRNRKYRLFFLLAFLPGGVFPLASRLYFALPSWLRR